MRNLAVIGGQWGDEGKGKVIDLLADTFDVVARFQGGHNAGHSVEVDGERYALHLVPSGIVRKGRTCVIGNGVVIDPAALVDEIRGLERRGVKVAGRLFVSSRAHVIFPFHQAFDAAKESEVGGRKIGTTLRGIGPAYLTKAARLGVRVCDLVDRRALREGLDIALGFWNRVLVGGYRQPPIDGDAIMKKYARLGRTLLPYVTDTSAMLEEAMRAGRSILFEGAQGVMLDVDHGTYPFVTSSNATAGGAAPGLGVPPATIGSVVGVFKAYSTRVGAGPFVTEERGTQGDLLRERGREYGTTTGRPRRCGWFDAVAARYARRLCGFDAIALTLFDVLDALAEIPVAVGYRYRGSVLKNVPPEIRVLEQCRPVYEVRAGWQSSTRDVRDPRKLPARAKDYVKRLEDLLEAPVMLVSTGPARDEVLIYRPALARRVLPAPRATAGKRAGGASAR